MTIRLFGLSGLWALEAMLLTPMRRQNINGIAARES
jgi:hypothetical protein